MKKTLITLVLCIVCIINFISCSKKEPKFYACEVEQVYVYNGMDSLVPMNVLNCLCWHEDTTNAINTFWNTKEDYEYMWMILTIHSKYECNYPRTYVPLSSQFFSVKDTLEDNKYKCTTSIKGACKNGFGVDCEIMSVIDFVLSRDSANRFSVEVIEVSSF